MLFKMIVTEFCLQVSGVLYVVFAPAVLINFALIEHMGYDVQTNFIGALCFHRNGLILAQCGLRHQLFVM
jgi:hypothetical protein